MADIDDFSFITTGRLTLDAGKSALANNGKMISNSITLSAETFVPDTDPAPAFPGSYEADTFDISTDGNFITNADLVSGSDLVISAPGSIVAANIEAAGLVQLGALGGSMTVSDILAGGLVDLFANVNVSTGDIAGDSRWPSWRLPVASARATCSTANGVDLQATGDIAFGDVSSCVVDIAAGGGEGGGC